MPTSARDTARIFVRGDVGIAPYNSSINWNLFLQSAQGGCVQIVQMAENRILIDFV